MTEEIGLVPSQRLETGLNSHLVYQDEALRFNCGPPPQRRVGDPGPKTRDLSGFIDERYFAPQGSDFRRSIYGEGQDRDGREVRNWHGNGATATRSGDGSVEDDDEEEDEVDDDDEVDEGDVEVEGIVGANDNNKVNCSNNSSIVEDKMGNGKGNHQNHSSFGKDYMEICGFL